MPTGRILVCGTLVAGGITAAAGCPIPAAGLLGVAIVSAAGLASNTLASEITWAIDARGFDPQANQDTRRAIGRAVGDALEIEGRKYSFLSADRRGLHRLAKVADTRWVESLNVADGGAFASLHERHAVDWFTAGLDGQTGRPAPAFAAAHDWLQVFGELRRLGGFSSLPSQAAQDAAAGHLHLHFHTRLRNDLKGDPNKPDPNRPFVALQLDFMRLLMDSQRKALARLGEQGKVADQILSEIKQIRASVTARTRPTGISPSPCAPPLRPWPLPTLP